MDQAKKLSFIHCNDQLDQIHQNLKEMTDFGSKTFFLRRFIIWFLRIFFSIYGLTTLICGVVGETILLGL